ncbi:MAG: hypothetical protein M3275_08795 [Thermoproteota archaeon]|nr:hypothetical protein [Thermoproteota archaeon]
MNTRYATAFVTIAILLVAVTLTVTTTSGVFAQTEDAEDTSSDSTNQIDGSSGIAEDAEDQDEPGEDILETEDDSESAEEEIEYTSSFRTEDCTFSATGSNPYFILEPNYRQVLVANESGTEVELIITVLNETREINGTETRVVEERETENGELVEVSRNFFAICDETNSVFYFGEEVDDYENGTIVGHEGAWLAGEGDNKAGMFMPGTVLLGARYYQEIAPGVAVDRAEIIEIDGELVVPAGSFDDVLVVVESNPLEPGVEELNYYAAGVGVMQDEDEKLVEYGFTDGQ